MVTHDGGLNLLLLGCTRDIPHKSAVQTHRRKCHAWIGRGWPSNEQWSPASAEGGFFSSEDICIGLPVVVHENRMDTTACTRSLSPSCAHKHPPCPLPHQRPLNAFSAARIDAQCSSHTWHSCNHLPAQDITRSTLLVSKLTTGVSALQSTAMAE